MNNNNLIFKCRICLSDKIENFQEKTISFWQSINLDRVGILGHSFGGTTGIVASYKDNRIDACIALDGWIVPVESSIIYLIKIKPKNYCTIWLHVKKENSPTV